ncbi:hypothetical protein Kisp01_27870 [Kineosporia sp. NBRC 101677]|nr:hypothetical protein Kisp01_27870 [Kineosporia sp. NBRC 101677]
MRLRRRVLGVATAVTATIGVSSVALMASPASADTTGKAAAKGDKSLASVLLADKGKFDHNSKDFDVLRSAVLAVLKEKPKSPVGVLTKGDTALTAFLPNDHAFRVLVKDITKAHKLPSEKAAFKAVAGLGIDTVETVLLYHVVPGATLSSKAALKSDDAVLKTAQGGTVKLNVSLRYPKVGFHLIDADKSDKNARVIGVDVNKGNKQIGHVVDRVLRPVDLP